MSTTFKPEDVVSKECRFVTYVGNPHPDEPDLHVVKEIVHLKDGTKVPNLNLLYDAPRPYWVTKKGFRNHQQHKEWEKEERLVRNECPERFLISRIAAAIGTPWFRGNRRKLFECPYIYGVDIDSTSVIKRAYDVKYKIDPTPWTLAEFDIETDMTTDDDQGKIPTMGTLTMKERMLTVVVKDYFKGYANACERVEKLTMKYLGKWIIERNIKPQIIVVDTPLDMFKAIFAAAHEWQPDWLSIWNMEFEMDRFMEICEQYGANPADIVCDPRIPVEYRSFEYIKSEPQKKTSSGKITPVKPSARWHTDKVPASFYIIDQMCVYKQTRMGEQEEPYYSLNFIMEKELKFGKLEIEEAKHIEHATADWHYYMQKNHPLEYVVYNRFDCLGPELLDEKIKDLALTLPSMAKTSNFGKFPSQPRRTCDDLHWEIMDMGLVMGVSSSNVSDEYDDDTLSRQDWIIALKAALVEDNGLKIIEELPNTNTRVYAMVADLDVSASYPNGEIALNTSKETTVREIISIGDVPEEVFRMQNMGISGGHVNAVDYCTMMMNFPTHFEMLEAFQEDTQAALVEVPA